MHYTDDFLMRKALAEAQIAFEEGEIPVGVIICIENTIIAKAHNQTEKLTDITAHAEILAITSACQYLGSKYLAQCTMYVTLEPCVMCAGAIFWSQLGRLVIGASDEVRGFRKFSTQIIHPKTLLTTQVLAQECSEIISLFFKKIRNK